MPGLIRTPLRFPQSSRSARRNRARRRSIRRQNESGVFAAQIRPILAARCYQCHGPDLQQNGLRLDSLAAILKGSANGNVVIPGDSDKSPLVRRILGLDRPQHALRRSATLR